MTERCGLLVVGGLLGPGGGSMAEAKSSVGAARDERQRGLGGGRLPSLLARPLAWLRARYGPDSIVVMSRAGYEREQAATYAAGWQDAVEEYGPRISAARWEGWLGRWRPLRGVAGSGSGEVVGFPGIRLPA